MDALISVVASAVVAGGWWYAAIRLQRHWFLYSLAAVATVGTLISAGIIFLAGSGKSLIPLLELLHIQSIVAVVDALLFLVFVCWLVRFPRDTHVA
jgi:hypothetical protein